MDMHTQAGPLSKQNSSYNKIATFLKILDEIQSGAIQPGEDFCNKKCIRLKNLTSDSAFRTGVYNQQRYAPELKPYLFASIVKGYMFAYNISNEEILEKIGSDSLLPSAMQKSDFNKAMQFAESAPYYIADIKSPPPPFPHTPSK